VCVCLLYSAALCGRCDALLLVCVGTASVCVCYTMLHSLDGVMCCNWSVLVQRVCVSVIQCCTEWTV